MLVEIIRFYWTPKFLLKCDGEKCVKFLGNLIIRNLIWSSNKSGFWNKEIV